MTTTAREHSGGEAGRSRRSAARGRGSWNRVWQIPLLLAGVAAFGWGVRSLVRKIKPVPFSTHVSDVRTMLAAEKFEPAIERINYLSGYFKQPGEVAVLEELAGDALYLAQQKQPAFVRENYQRVADHYRKAIALGYTPDATMDERWGESALALGDAPLGMEKLEAAIAADPHKLRDHVRDLVAAYVANGRPAKALTILNQMLEENDASIDDRAWALCKRIEILMHRRSGGAGGKELQQAIDETRATLKGIPERDPAGRMLLWMGRAELEEGQLDAADRDLRDARERFVVHHLDDGRAAVLLGKIAESRGKLKEAGEFYQDVVMREAGTSVWPAARFGRAEVQAMQGDFGEQTEADYRFVTDSLRKVDVPDNLSESIKAPAHVPEMVTVDQLRASLVAQYERSNAADRLDEALKCLSLLGDLHDPETAAMTYRLATTKEKRAAELIRELAEHPAADEGARREQKAAATRMLADAARDYARHAKLSTMDDAVSGNSLWRAAQLFDQAGKTKESIATYQQFTTERPHDARTPEGLLAMGRLYESAGMIEQAIPMYERDIKENPRTPAAYTAAVNLARCYMMQGPEQFPKAEQSLLSLVQDNMDLLPTAKEFRESLFTLGELYYRNGRWADAILRLEEALTRYPGDTAASRATFMLAECYRRSAGDIADALAKNPAIEHRESLDAARRERLRRAAGYFTKVIGALDTAAEQIGLAATEEKKLSPLEETYLRTSYMDRAECSFALADYPMAIHLYDQAATRFPQHVMAVECYVQIVNAYLAMKEKGQASAAAERAEWILKRIPDTAFAEAAVPVTRQYYEAFFKLGKARAGS